MARNIWKTKYLKLKNIIILKVIINMKTRGNVWEVGEGGKMEGKGEKGFKTVKDAS